MQINKSSKSGFTLVEIMIVVAIIGLLAAIAIPNFIKARTASQTNACIANLKQIQGAVATFALEAKKPAGGSITYPGDIIGPTLYIKTEPKCPAGGTYVIANVDATPTCSLGGTHVLP